MSFIRCQECLIPTTRPDTAFENGICSACLNFKRRAEVDWGQRLSALHKILDGARGGNGSGYDVIVPSSGGKDSHYQVLTLLKMGIKPLVVTAETCMLSELGEKNIANLKRYADTVRVTYDPETRRVLNILGQELVGDISWPEHVAIFSAPFRVAVQLGIPTIFYGECPQAEYGGPIGEEGALQMTRRWIHEFGGHLGLRPKDIVGMRGISEEAMAEYALPSEAAMEGIKAFFLGQFIPWDSYRNAEVAISAGMRFELPGPGNYWPWENLDNVQTGLHDFLAWVKYGYGRACAQVSVDIRSGRLTREEGLEIIRERDGAFPSTYLGVPVDRVLHDLGKDMSWLTLTMERFREKVLFCGYDEPIPGHKRFILNEFSPFRS